MLPRNFVSRRMSFDVTLEVDIISFLQITRIDCRTKIEGYMGGN